MNKNNIEHRFFTNLSCEAVADIIARQKTSYFRNGICGSVNNKQIEIYHSSTFKSMSNPTFYGAISEQLEGTMISGSFQPDGFGKIVTKIARGFSIVVFIFLLLGGGIRAALIVTPFCLTMFFGAVWMDRVEEEQGREAKIMIFHFFEKELLAKPESEDVIKKDIENNR